MLVSVPPATARAKRVDHHSIRSDFPILGETANGRPRAYLDNAATTQKPLAVIEAVESFYRHTNANVHRGIHALSEKSTEAFEGARERIARFFGIDDSAELVWTRGATEALNLVASSWGTANLGPGDEVLLTVMEHHSNLVPWQMVAERTGARLRFIPLDGEQRLDLDRLDDLLTPRTRVVSLCHVSNALGTINPVRLIAERAHAVGAIVIVDGAQSAGHLPIDLSEIGCDFFAFSGHKMYGPTGMGGLWGRRELLQAMPPYQGGGSMIDEVRLERSTFAQIPQRFEAGTPHIAGAVGLAAAADYLDRLGREDLHATEQRLVDHAVERLGRVPGLRIYGPRDPGSRSGVISFTLQDIHPHDIATILDGHGVAIRAGHHCTQPLMDYLGVSATARISFSFYNTLAEIDQLLEGLEDAVRIFSGRGAP